MGVATIGVLVTTVVAVVVRAAAIAGRIAHRNVGIVPVVEAWRAVAVAAVVRRAIVDGLDVSDRRAVGRFVKDRAVNDGCVGVSAVAAVSTVVPSADEGRAVSVGVAVADAAARTTVVAAG